MNQKDLLDIIPECYADTNFVECLLNTKNVNHQKSCNKVTGIMQQGKLKDGFALGIIDDDKHKSDYTKQFRVIVSTTSFDVLKHNIRSHYLVYIKPAIEGFILNSAKEIGLDLNRAGYPDTLEGLKNITKHQLSKNDPYLRNLFKALKESPSCIALRSVIQYLYANKYNATDEEIKKSAR